MFRTWSVRFDAMPFTDSVRSRHVPDTPFTSAWPPSLPSVPTSRATRVTSSANDESWSTIVFTVVPMRRNSPFTGWPSIVRAILRSRSPSATASSTEATSVVGRTRSSISALSDSTLEFQPPPAGAQRGALVHPALAPDHAPHPAELLLHARVHGHQLVVGGGDLAEQARAGGGTGAARSRRRGPPRGRRGSPRARPARCRRRSRRRAVRWRFGPLPSPWGASSASWRTRRSW